MRVLMLVSEAPPIKSGIARVAGELTAGLRGLGLTIDVLSANEIPRWTFKEFRLSSLALRWPAIARQLDDYDILHVHGSVPTFSDVGLLLGRIAASRAARPFGLVYTHHSDIDIAGLDLPVSLYNRLHSGLIRLADHVVASTPSYALRLEGSGRPGRTSAVGFGVNAGQFQSPLPKAERFTALFVGQLRPYKGVDVLLHAWQQMGDADLHIVGDGHERAALEALAHDLGLESVYFHGAVTDRQLTDFYAQAHTLVLPSNRKAEAFGLVLLEGMAAGCVPIASNLPGVCDVVGTSGFTFPVGDSDALAALLQRVRDEPRMRRQLAAQAAERAVATAWDHTAQGYAGIYRQVLLGRQLELAHGAGGPQPAALEAWIRAVATATAAARASLMLVEPNGRDLRIAASVGLPPGVAATTRLRLGQRLAGLVAQTGHSMLLRPRKLRVVAHLYGNNPDLSSSLILPLHHHGHPVGVLNLARGGQAASFTAEDERWLQRLALQAAPLLADYHVAAMHEGVPEPMRSGPTRLLGRPLASFPAAELAEAAEPHADSAVA